MECQDLFSMKNDNKNICLKVLYAAVVIGACRVRISFHIELHLTQISHRDGQAYAVKGPISS